jgi:dienelactone hydrolase
VVLMLALTVVVGDVASASARHSTVEATAPAQPRPIYTYGVGTKSVTFVDMSRPTKPSGSFPGASTRTLQTAIYYPAAIAPSSPITPNAAPAPPPAGHLYPLILFSHGLQASGNYFVSLISRWASAGYVVAAPEYPLTNMAAISMYNINLEDAFADVKNQSADARFVINEVLKSDSLQRRPRARLLGGIVDPESIGAAGHSVGGTTTYGLAHGHLFSGNPRIGAAVAMSACAGFVGNRANYFQQPVPVLIVHGDQDQTVPIKFSLQAFAAAKQPKFGFTFMGAGHNIPFTGSGNTSTLQTQAMALWKGTVDFWDRYLKLRKPPNSPPKYLNRDLNVPGLITPFPPSPALNPASLTKCVRGLPGP